jgi:outer membrane protein assembly factor BamB
MRRETGRLLPEVHGRSHRIAVLALIAATVAAGPLAASRAAAAPATHRPAAAHDLAAAHSAAARAPGRPARRPPTDWPAYLNGPEHHSYSPGQKAITPASAPNLVSKWHFDAGTQYFASPTVANGSVYIGSDTGWFYQLKERTGKVEHKRFIGFQATTTCAPALGVVSTATYGTDPATHRPSVYVAGPDGYLYALRASNLALEWKAVVGIPSGTVNDYFNYASPTVTHGKVYIGIASNCDTPLVRGGVLAFSQATGRKLAHLYTVPRGQVGGSVWSSVAVAPGGDLYVSTGNGPEDHQLLGLSESILKLSPRTLRVVGKFQIPSSQVDFDADFGASPVIIGRQYVGACDKNGIFYMLNQATMKVHWEKQVGSPSGVYLECIATPAYNGHDLFLGTPSFTIGGTQFEGAVQERNADTGKLVWATGLPNGVTGSPSLDGAGVLAVGTFDGADLPNITYLVNSHTGAILSSLVQGYDFAQSVFANGWLFTANDSGVYAWAPRS